MIEITGKDRLKFKDFFKEVPYMKACIDAVLENEYQYLAADDIDNPSVAGIWFNGCVIFAGDANSPYAEEILSFYKLKPKTLAYSPEWNKLLIEKYENILKKSERYYLPYTGLDKKNIEAISKVKNSKVRNIENSDFDKLEEAIEFQQQDYFFKNADDFINNGFGYIYEIDGKIQSGASAYCRSSKYAECEVFTNKDYRNKGLGTAVTTAFLNECLKNDVQPHWDTAYYASALFGKSLGYNVIEKYEVFEIMPPGGACCQG